MEAKRQVDKQKNVRVKMLDNGHRIFQELFLQSKQPKKDEGGAHTSMR